MEVKPRLFTKKEWNKFHRVRWESITIELKEYTPWIESAELFDSIKEAEKAFKAKYQDLKKVKLK